MTSMRMALTDLRDSWSAWAAVSLTFVVTGAAVGLSGLILYTANAAPGLVTEQQQVLSITGGTNVTFSVLVALAVISTSTGLVISSRRGAIARLLLAGAGPGQVVRILLLQLGVVALVCSLVGNAIAVLLQPWFVDLANTDRGYADVQVLTPLWVLLLSSGFCAGIAMVAGARQAVRATRIPPVEALRAATGTGPAPTRWWATLLRWLAFTAVAAITIGILVAVRVGADELGSDGFNVVTQAAALILPLCGVALTLVSASVMAPITRAWTSLIPLPGPTWHLARHIVVARSDRLVKSVIPVMFAVGLLFGMIVIATSVSATLVAIDAGFELSAISAGTLVTSVGLPLAIAFAGSVGNLVMMTRQRDAEVALNGVIGATPRQQLLLPALEATIVTGTAAIFGLVMVLVSTGVLAYGMEQVLPVSEIVIPWGSLAVILLLCWGVTLLATVLPGLPSLRQPAPRVIARLVAS